MQAPRRARRDARLAEPGGRAGPEALEGLRQLGPVLLELPHVTLRILDGADAWRGAKCAPTEAYRLP